MDCEKAEPLLLDELYDELDEVTSAAVKRHVSGCARCGSILSGFRNTRKLAALPLVPLPAGLEDRILASIKETQKVVGYPDGAKTWGSPQSRLARVLSLAGSWAMRPQTAMAAVFLLMIGTSAFVIRSRRAEAPQAVSVTEQGAPAATALAPAEQDSLDSKAAAAAHGPNAPAPITRPPVVATAAPAASGSNGQLALSDSNAAGPVDGLTGGKGRLAKRDGRDGEEAQGALASALAEAESSKDKDTGGSEAKLEARKNAPVGNVAPAAQPTTATRSASNRRGGDITNAGPPAGAPYGGDDYAPRGQTVAPAAKEKAAEGSDAFSSGMAAYRARKFADATKEFDNAAKAGDQNAALWAAKSVKEGNGGCNAAIPRFDAVSQKAGDTYQGHEAQLEAARCQIALGRLDEARARLVKLQTVASHSSQAQQALNELNQVAARREADRAKGGAGSGGAAGAARAAPAPAKAPAAPRATAVDQAGF